MNISVSDLDAAIEGLIRNDPTKVLYMHFDYRISLDGKYDTRDLAMGVHYLCFSPSQRVRMAAKVNRSFLARDYDPEPKDSKTPWRIQSDHDSCWRTDGFDIFGRIYRDVVYKNPNCNGFYKDLPDILYPEEKFKICDNPTTYVHFEHLKLLTIDDVKDIMVYGYRDKLEPLVNSYYYEKQHA